MAAQVLVKLGADLTRVRQQVIQLLSGYQGKPRGGRGRHHLRGWRVRPVGVAGARPVRSQPRPAAPRWRGKLDPVIGREEEIERVMQVLSAAPRTTRC